MPSEWTTKEQKVWLLRELATFKQLGGRRYAQQWSNLYMRWFQEWPERPVALPNVPLDATLTEEQNAILWAAILRRRSQLRRWLQWHAGAGANRSANNKTAKVIDNMLKPKTRIKKPWEIYSKVYYKTRIQPHIKSGMTIADVVKKIRELYENESADIKEEVRMLSVDHLKGNKNGGSHSEARDLASSGPDVNNNGGDVNVRCSNIKQCGPALRRILEHLSSQTGWHFSVLMGGPDPQGPLGNNVVRSLHVGKTSNGSDFSNFYADFDTVVMAAYGMFLAKAFGKTSSAVQPLTTGGSDGIANKDIAEESGEGVEGRGDEHEETEEGVGEGRDINVDVNKEEARHGIIADMEIEEDSGTHPAPGVNDEMETLSAGIYNSSSPSTTSAYIIHLATPPTTALATPTDMDLATLPTTSPATLPAVHLAIQPTITDLANVAEGHCLMSPPMPTEITATQASAPSAMPHLTMHSGYRSMMSDAVDLPDPAQSVQFDPLDGFFAALLGDTSAPVVDNNWITGDPFLTSMFRGGLNFGSSASDGPGE